MRIFICKHCGNIICYERNSGVKVICCGEEMEEVVPGSVDAAVEKHVPVVEIEDNKVIVQVGEVEHPMVEEHFIEWISIETKKGSQNVRLNPGDKPYAEFLISKDDEFVGAYAYCNLHGYWQSK